MIELHLFRHAPIARNGRLIGRTDLPAELPDWPARPPAEYARIWCSPALRCRQTAAWLWPDQADIPCDPALWEQDFGAWEGQTYDQLPDLGPLPRAALAAHRPPGGESFADLCDRLAGFLARLEGPGPIALMAHAGIIRGALGVALGQPEAGLAFEIAPLSCTKLTRLPGGWGIGAVNLPLDAGDHPWR